MSRHEALRNQFENQEAIYVDRRALRVRVYDIHVNPGERTITADIEEIPTVGLGVEVFTSGKSQGWLAPILSWFRKKPNANRFQIKAGILTTFSDDTWSMGYGGWTLFFDENIVEGIVSLAADWYPEEKSDDVLRYNSVLSWLQKNGAYDASYYMQEKVFPDECC